MSLSLWPVWLCTYFDSGSTELNGVGCHSKHTGRNKRFLCHVHVRRTTWASFNMVNRKVCQQTAHEVNTFLHSRWDRWAMLDKATGELVATTLELHEYSNKRLGRNWDIKTCWDFFEGHCWVKVVKVLRFDWFDAVPPESGEFYVNLRTRWHRSVRLFTWALSIFCSLGQCPKSLPCAPATRMACRAEGNVLGNVAVAMICTGGAGCHLLF